MIVISFISEERINVSLVKRKRFESLVLNVLSYKYRNLNCNTECMVYTKYFVVKEVTMNR